MAQVVQQEALTRWLTEEGIFTQKEFSERVKGVDKEMKKRQRRDELMIVYVVFCKDYEHRRGELMACW